MGQIKRILLSLLLTCVLGFGGVFLYFLGYDNSPLHSAERWGAYLLIWPLIAIESLGGVDPAYRGTSWKPVIQIAWIGLWVYYYLVVIAWERKSRRS